MSALHRNALLPDCPACPLCGEPTSLGDYCAACVEPEASRFGSQDAPTSWLTIAAAAVGTGVLVFLTWNGSLFG
jgi:hypothetical protein